MGLLVLAALLTTYEPVPPASRILVLQEAQARQQMRSKLVQQPVNASAAAAPRSISAAERQQLQLAAQRFIEERAGEVMDLR